MQHVTLEQLSEILAIMTITQSVDSGFAITHHGHVEGVRTIAISTYYGTGDCYLIQ